MAGIAATPLLGGLFTLGEAFSVGGTILGAFTSAAGARQAGRADNTLAVYQAKQAEQQAGQERAAAQRQAMEERRRARLAQSRAIAVGAASGAGTGGNVLDILGDLNTEGEYRAQSALFTGEEKARGYEMSASAKRYEGAQSVANAKAKSTGYLVGGGMSLLEKYG